ncbi:MAG: hypothetical protein QXN87_08685 [Candidatus Bathyarchaeia archaeon]
MGKRVFSTNWHIYRACLPTLSGKAESDFALAALKLQKLMDDGDSFKNSELRKKDFNTIFLEALDETLASLGESCRQSIYFHLENSFKIERQDIPLKIEEFARAIESIFGFGARLIEIQIMKRLHTKIGGFKYYPKDENLSFAQYAKAIKILNQALNTI